MLKTDSSRRIQVLVWSGLSLIILFILVAFVESKLKRTSSPLPVISQVPEFTLTNQTGRAVALDDLRGQVWVADIIFTRCPGPCPRMTARMSELQSGLDPDDPVKLVSLTTDPGFDTPEVLHRYARRFDADHDRWLFLTGDKPEIVKVAVDGLKLAAMGKNPDERESPADLFIHSTIFVVVDKQGRLRASFQTEFNQFDEEGAPITDDTPGASWEETRTRLLETVEQLVKED